LPVLFGRQPGGSRSLKRRARLARGETSFIREDLCLRASWAPQVVLTGPGILFGPD
jgi:hypothetical protein